jgi:nitric oxide reductase large subunit
MKTLASKSGLIITMLLVVAMLAFGYVSQKNQATSEDCSVTEKPSSNAVQSKLNLKGMTRHLLDFYK